MNTVHTGSEITITNVPASLSHGLKEEELAGLRQTYGKNVITAGRKGFLLPLVKDVVTEPMFLMLTLACAIYFFLGESGEGLLMLTAICIVTAISIFQGVKSNKALRGLQQLTDPKVHVVRDGQVKTIPSDDLLPGDLMMLEEGNKVTADARVVQGNDLTVNEAAITGESFPVAKNEKVDQNQLYQGSTINSGRCLAMVTATGNHTVLGRAGKAIASFTGEKSLLLKEINRFVVWLTVFGILAFLVIFLVNYLKSGTLISSLLLGLTLAMAAIPEEIPVAFSSFMALGAFYLSRYGVITRQPQVVESLGSVTVLCLDKTGTITENQMSVHSTFYYHPASGLTPGPGPGGEVLYYAYLASEQDPFDSMEKAIKEAYDRNGKPGNYTPAGMIHEYPLEGHPPMMTHVYASVGEKLAASKGSIERIVQACHPDETVSRNVLEKARQLASDGYRVLGVARALYSGEALPQKQDDFAWQFIGLLCLYDPPKENVKEVLPQFYRAGIGVKLITGDYPETALNIATQVGLVHNNEYLSGDAVMTMPDADLKRVAGQVSIFARMFPEAKMRVINMLKEAGEVVAMTGDGVNDGPALKVAHIGIAMGKKGTDLARQTADLVLTDDNLEKVAIAVRQGRRIFSNIRKAVRYIISIHIPIILTASVPLLLGWAYPNIFTPIHVIFLELIMGPTCSIFFEREPAEEHVMSEPPHRRGMFTRREAGISVAQGLVISIGVLGLYYSYMISGHSIEETRTVVFTTLVISNILLTFVSRSFTESLSSTIRYKNNLALPVFVASVIFLMAINYIPWLRGIFGLAPLEQTDLLICTGVALLSVSWFELYKFFRRGAERKSMPAQ
ncbi:MAG TPA: cation-translocating P-type ATPase [Chitinophagaceae bacterium]